jgi:hypothetical protein
VPHGMMIRPRSYYNKSGLIILGKKGTPPDDWCNGILDYRGANCDTFRRYQCWPGTDCEAHSCTYQGSPCYWMCHWEPGGSTCEDLCDSVPLTQCYQRTTQGFCDLGWGCSWGPEPEIPQGQCNGELDYRGANCDTFRRRQCAPGTDCDAHGCTYQGSPCYHLCHWQPGGETCEELCDSMPLTPCEQRSTYESCLLGWGCYWGNVPPPPPPPTPTCKGVLDYRGADCNTFRRRQCAPSTDCDAHDCTYQGSPCYWQCNWEPGGSTCEDLCDGMPLTPCTQRPTQSFCELGWGCYWE